MNEVERRVMQTIAEALEYQKQQPELWAAVTDLIRKAESEDKPELYGVFAEMDAETALAQAELKLIEEKPGRSTQTSEPGLDYAAIHEAGVIARLRAAVESA